MVWFPMTRVKGLRVSTAMCKQRHTSTLLVQERSLRSVALRVRATMVLQIKHSWCNNREFFTGNPSLESSDDPSGRDQRLDIRGQPPTRAHRQSQGKLATHIKRARPSLATSHSQLFGSPRGAFTHGASFRLRTGATEAAVLLLKSPTRDSPVAAWVLFLFLFSQFPYIFRAGRGKRRDLRPRFSASHPSG